MGRPVVGIGGTTGFGIRVAMPRTDTIMNCPGAAVIAFAGMR
jgi:hypothetical protein